VFAYASDLFRDLDWRKWETEVIFAYLIQFPWKENARTIRKTALRGKLSSRLINLIQNAVCLYNYPYYHWHDSGNSPEVWQLANHDNDNGVRQQLVQRPPSSSQVVANDIPLYTQCLCLKFPQLTWQSFYTGRAMQNLRYKQQLRHGIPRSHPTVCSCWQRQLDWALLKLSRHSGTRAMYRLQSNGLLGLLYS